MAETNSDQITCYNDIKVRISLFVYGILWTCSQCIFSKRFVGVADRDFLKTCFINDLSDIRNLHNLSNERKSLKVSLTIAVISFVEILLQSK